MYNFALEHCILCWEKKMFKNQPKNQLELPWESLNPMRSLLLLHEVKIHENWRILEGFFLQNIRLFCKWKNMWWWIECSNAKSILNVKLNFSKWVSNISTRAKMLLYFENVFFIQNFPSDKIFIRYLFSANF